MITHAKKIDRMPERTWSWLKVNTADIFLYAPEDKKEESVLIQASDKIEVRKDFTGVTFKTDPSKHLMNEEIESFIEQNSNIRYYIRIPKNHKEEEPIRITLEITDEYNVIGEDIVIEAEENSESTIIVEYRSKGKEEGYHSGRTRVLVHEKACLKLVRAQLFHDEVKHNDILGAQVQKEGKLTMIQAEMGSSGSTAGWNVLLSGEESEVNLDLVYVGEKEKKLDFTSRIEYQAAKTNGQVRARGVLLGKSKKILRDTLDFVSGSKGAKGREEEDVLMLSKNVRNISVPLLFCGEDDVQGEHAASSGRPSDSTLFYLMSRGLSEAEAKKLLAESKFAAILEEMKEEALKEEILSYLRVAIEEGGYMSEGF